MDWALNHMTTPQLGYVDFLDLARSLGCVGVEVRNDIARPLFDGLDPAEAGRIARGKGLRLVGLSQVYPFNDWNEARAEAVRALLATGKAAGAESVSLIPRNDGQGIGNGERQANLRIALKAILPMLEDADMVAWVEPLGFARSSLRFKDELVEILDALDARRHVRLVHDTFHHALVGCGPIHPDLTGMVHISGVVNPIPRLDELEDAHRVLVDARDRLGNVEQLAALRAAGYDGPVSVECFSPEVHALADPGAAIRQSFDYISSRLRALAA